MNTVALRQGSQLAVGTQQGGWTWDGTRWVCGDGDDFCPPFFPPGPPPWYPPPQGQPPWYPGANGGVSFGTSPPPNPIRGAFWWDGTGLWMFDGAAWVGVGGASGGGTTPPSVNPPANPTPGQQWFNGTTLYVWDGNAWVPVSATKSTISSTAPPAPNPGDTWWNGTQMFIWDGTAWRVVGPGATPGPIGTTSIVFGMSSPSSLVLPGSQAWGIVPFSGTPLSDTLNGWNQTTHQYLPNRAGIYAIMARGLPGAGQGGIAIVKNDNGSFTGGLGSDIIIGIVSGSGTYWLEASGNVQMNGTSDYVRIWAWAADGSWHPTGSNSVFVATLFP